MASDTHESRLRRRLGDGAHAHTQTPRPSGRGASQFPKRPYLVQGVFDLPLLLLCRSLRRRDFALQLAPTLACQGARSRLGAPLGFLGFARDLVTCLAGGHWPLLNQDESARIFVTPCARGET